MTLQKGPVEEAESVELKSALTFDFDSLSETEKAEVLQDGLMSGYPIVRRGSNAVCISSHGQDFVFDVVSLVSSGPSNRTATMVSLSGPTEISVSGLGDLLFHIPLQRDLRSKRPYPVRVSHAEVVAAPPPFSPSPAAGSGTVDKDRLTREADRTVSSPAGAQSAEPRGAPTSVETAKSPQSVHSTVGRSRLEEIISAVVPFRSAVSVLGVGSLPLPARPSVAFTPALEEQIRGMIRERLSQTVMKRVVDCGCDAATETWKRAEEGIERRVTAFLATQSGVGATLREAEKATASLTSGFMELSKKLDELKRNVEEMRGGLEHEWDAARGGSGVSP